MIKGIFKIIFAVSVTVPTFLSVGLIGMVKYSGVYIEEWKRLFDNQEVPNSCEWWSINMFYLFSLVCYIILIIFLTKGENIIGTKKTIEVKSYSYVNQNGVDQTISLIIPWMTLFVNQIDFVILSLCIIIQSLFIAIAGYYNNGYNMLCSFLGYRYYEVKTEESTYMLISKKCIKNKKDIKEYVEMTDYFGLMIN